MVRKQSADKRRDGSEGSSQVQLLLTPDVQQRRSTHLSSRVGVGSSFQKELRHVHLSIFRGHMERSKAFLLGKKHRSSKHWKHETHFKFFNKLNSESE